MFYRVRNGLHLGEFEVAETRDPNYGGVTYTSRTGAAKALLRECTAIQTRLSASKAAARKVLKEAKVAKASRKADLTP